MNNFNGKCPVCKEQMYVRQYQCEHCEIGVTGKFGSAAFSKLDESQLKFIEIFVKNQGNIKAVEKELDISYPTVKKHLDKIIKLMDSVKSSVRIEKVGDVFRDVTGMIKNIHVVDCSDDEGKETPEESEADSGAQNGGESAADSSPQKKKIKKKSKGRLKIVKAEEESDE